MRECVCVCVRVCVCDESPISNHALGPSSPHPPPLFNSIYSPYPL